MLSLAMFNVNENEIEGRKKKEKRKNSIRFLSVAENINIYLIKNKLLALNAASKIDRSCCRRADKFVFRFNLNVHIQLNDYLILISVSVFGAFHPHTHTHARILGKCDFLFRCCQKADKISQWKIQSNRFQSNFLHAINLIGN